MPWIRRHVEADAVKRNLTFCYLCQQQLPPKGRRTDLVNSEHIIPKAARGPAQDDSEWSPILAVHCRCHTNLKNEDEPVLQLWHTMMTRMPGEWPSAIRNLAGMMRYDTPHAEDVPRFVFKETAKLKRAVWNWVRGFHTLLYSEPLRPDRFGIIHPPVPSYTHDTTAPDGSIHPGSSIDETHALSQQILGSIAGAIQAGECDGVLAWGNRVRFVCRWLQPVSNGGFGCMWAIELDHFKDMKRNPDWPDFPWHGMFVLDHLPSGATLSPSRNGPTAQNDDQGDGHQPN